MAIDAWKRASNNVCHLCQAEEKDHESPFAIRLHCVVFHDGAFYFAAHRERSRNGTGSSASGGPRACPC
ncbi:MAG: hypothetical protein WA690_07060, partial [Candidatus Acidiferrales bacterium]